MYVLPKSDRCWRKAFEKTLDETLVNNEDEALIIEEVLNEQIDKAKLMHDSSQNPCTCTTHCEITIVAHFVKNNLTSTSSRPILYIDMSKLSCQLCSEFLVALHAPNTSPLSKKFYTRGCSGQ